MVSLTKIFVDNWLNLILLIKVVAITFLPKNVRSAKAPIFWEKLGSVSTLNMFLILMSGKLPVNHVISFEQLVLE